MKLFNVRYQYMPILERVSTIKAESEHDAQVLARREFFNESARSILDGNPMEILINVTTQERD